MIVVLALIAIGSAHLRIRQTRTRAEMYRIEADRLQARRTLWEQQIRLGELPTRRLDTAPLPDPPVELVAPGDDEISSNRPLASRTP